MTSALPETVLKKGIIVLKRILLATWLGTALMIAGCAAPAAEKTAEAADAQSPQGFLTELYGHYADKGPGAGIDIAAPGTLERYFTPELAQLIIADGERAKAANEVPNLDGDPFLGSQDWQVTELAIAVAKSSDPDKTIAMVKFNNYDRPVDVKLDLQRRPEGWRIAEIDWGYATLTTILRE